MSIFWGTFSPDEVPSSRRQQTLGLAPVIRHYNDRAVPGIGGLWYGMPVAWALLGIWLSEERRRRPLPSANAVEALVMSQALAAGGENMRRGSGQRKLAGRTDHSYTGLSARGAYVTQPRRMGTVQPLFQLGFVNGAAQRFNLYRLSVTGESFLEPFEREKRVLLAWAEGASQKKLATLWPSRSLPVEAARLLDRQLRQAGAGSGRRRALLETSPDDQSLASPLEYIAPPTTIDAGHWADLRSGVALVRLREAAVEVLSRVEQQIGPDPRASLKPADAIKPAGVELKQLVDASEIMLLEQDSSPGGEAHRFARACLAEPAAVIAELGRLDGAVVRLLPDGRLSLGPAGAGVVRAEDVPPEELGAASEADAPALVPELPRIANLYALATDLQSSRGSR